MLTVLYNNLLLALAIIYGPHIYVNMLRLSLKFCMHFLVLPCVLHVPSVLSFFLFED